MWKDFFYFTKRERIGIYVLVVMIAAVIGADWYFSARERVGVRKLSQAEKKEVDAFLAAVREDESYRKKNYYNNYAGQAPVVLSPFDPNVADSADFVRLGLKPFMARNILRYRAKGGKFRTPESFAKIYGLTEAQYKKLLPYILIGEQFRVKRDTVFEHVKRDSAAYFKYPAGTVIELNGADTAELKKIPGVGSGIARMIIGYRSRLGGFYKSGQLYEIRYVPKELDKWFRVNPALIRKINLNKASIERLAAHPYINFYRAKVIVEHRKKNGALKNLKQLALYEEFTKQDIERIAPYVEF